MSEHIIQNYKFEGELLEIQTYPEPVLTQIATEVTEFNPELEKLCLNMLFTMYHAPGIGLAAPQVGLSKRIFVMDVNYSREETGEDTDEYEFEDFEPRILINPEFLQQEGEIKYQEGCLSLPGVFEDVKRYEEVMVQYQDVHGKKHIIEADGLLSICMQHENDHLDGIVFIDRLSSLKKSFFKKKLIKAKKLEQA